MSDKSKSEKKPKPRWGAGHPQAMWRLGWTELRNAATLAPANVAAPSESGLYGTATPSEVVEQRNDDLQPARPEKNESVLKGRVNQTDRSAASRDDRGKDRPSMDKE